MPGHNDWFQVDLEKSDIRFNPYPFKELSLADAASFTAKKIYERYDNIYLGLSGGYDSEFLALSLLRNQIPFKPLIFVEHFTAETDHAFYFCKNNNLDPIVIEKDITRGNFPRALGKLSAKLPGRDFKGVINVYLALKVAQLGGHYLSGAGIPSTDTLYPSAPKETLDFLTATFYSDMLFGNRHPNNFYTYTIEILYAYIKNLDKTMNVQEAKAKLYDLAFRSKFRFDHLRLIEDHPYQKSDPEKRYIQLGTYDSFLEKLSEQMIRE